MILIALLAAAAVQTVQPPTLSTMYFGPGAKPAYAKSYEDLSVTIYPTGCLLGVHYKGIKAMHCLMSKSGPYPDSERGTAAIVFENVPLPVKP